MFNVIDLFAGCGGFSKGFEMAGYNVSLAIEKDEWAAETYKANHPKTKMICGDITQIQCEDLKLKKQVDGIIGGPPCQGFSLSGNRDKNDPRNSLFMEFVRFVDYYKPTFFVMENVTGILSMKTKNNELVKDIILHEFESKGYSVNILKLNAADYGVPQSRVRVFFIGFKTKLAIKPFTVNPSHTAQNYITIADAIMDLPQISAGEGDEIQQYTSKPQNTYQELMRKNSTSVYNHIAMKHSARIVERFSHIEFGQSEKDLPEEHKPRQRGNATKISGKTFSQNNYRPYPDKPSPTVPACFQSNFIHPYLNRNYTAREGARLQSFPDDYIFKGKRVTMSWEKNLSQYKQIGNAVPPLLAKAIASSIITTVYS